MYQNPRESLYKRIDEIEVILGLRGGPDDAAVALEVLNRTLETKGAL